MRVVEKSTVELTVTVAPWFLTVFLGAFSVGLAAVFMQQRAALDAIAAAALLLFIVVMAGVICFRVRWVKVDFSKATGRIEISSAGLFGTTLRHYALAHFMGAREDRLADSDGATSRLVLVFSDAMVGDLDPVERETIERGRKLGLHAAAINEVPLTAYFTSGSGAKDAALVVNAWAARGSSH